MGDAHIETEALFIVILPQANKNSVKVCVTNIMVLRFINGQEIHKFTAKQSIPVDGLIMGSGWCFEEGKSKQ